MSNSLSVSVSYLRGCSEELGKGFWQQWQQHQDYLYRKSYIQMMELEAQQAERIGRARVIVQDNGPIHRCQEVQQLWSKWEHMGLYVFFLPKYCSEMNPIELEWQHLKKDELSGQMFDDEFNKCLCRNRWGES